MSAFRAHVAQFVCPNMNDSQRATSVFDGRTRSSVSGSRKKQCVDVNESSRGMSAVELTAAADERARIAKRTRIRNRGEMITVKNKASFNVGIRPKDGALVSNNGDGVKGRVKHKMVSGEICFKIERSFKPNKNKGFKNMRSATNAVTDTLCANPTAKDDGIAGVASTSANVHVEGLPDYLHEGLDLVFCGINPGSTSGRLGHHYAGPGNCFYEILFKSGLTKGRRVTYNDDKHFPEWFDFGVTNVCTRVTKSAKDLKREEIRAGLVTVVEVCRKYRPRYLCFNGLVLVEQFCKLKQECGLERQPVKGTADFSQSKDGTPGLCSFRIPWDGGKGCTHVFAIPSTSGIVSHYTRADRVRLLQNLKQLMIEDPDVTRWTSDRR